MANYHKPESKTIQELRDIANKLRIHSITSTDAGKSGKQGLHRLVLMKLLKTWSVSNDELVDGEKDKMKHSPLHNF
ncbi:Transketolase-like protein 1 [Orchesella cincta]|uniref:Transketolase-like protein 1 n=1 Tax=Orchesella cincta TaxID=48709 RepID=A0A1D2N9T3_ORCCI|nr:Transketolase-like protein 1 [Orchesella cincta]